MIESTLLQEWTDQAVAKAVVKTQTQTYRETTLDALNTRFPRKIPKDLHERIQAEQDPVRLKDWHHKAIGAKTLAKFRSETGI